MKFLYFLLTILVVSEYRSTLAAKVLMSEHSFPSLEETPDSIFITLMGYQNTQDLIAKDYSEEALAAAVENVFYEADLDADSLLDIKELVLWHDKNDKLNSGAAFKIDFKKADSNNDGLVSFLEISENLMGGSFDKVFRSKYVLKNDELNRDRLLGKEAEMVDKDGIPNDAYMIQKLYKVFDVADANQDGLLTWEEFVVYSDPESYKETFDLVSRVNMANHDKNKDGKFDLREFDILHRRIVIIPELLPEEIRNPKDMFKKCDTDNDRSLSHEEFDECTKGHFAANHWEPSIIMKEVDQNNDQRLSKEEIINSFEDILESDFHWEDRDEL